MESKTFNILNVSAKATGWVHRGTLCLWEEKCDGHTIPTNIPPALPSFKSSWGKASTSPPVDLCTFWFNLEYDENIIIGFDWHSKAPNIVKTVNGGWQTATPIDLSYITSQKKLRDYFSASKISWKPEIKPATVFTRVIRFLTREII